MHGYILKDQKWQLQSKGNINVTCDWKLQPFTGQVEEDNSIYQLIKDPAIKIQR